MCITLKEEIKTLSEVTMMKTNRFEELYCKVQELRKLYNEGEKEKAQQSCNELKETIKNEENGFKEIWTMYQKAKENKNQYLDLNEVIWDNEVKIAWLFKQNGCTLEGLIEINEGFEDFETGEMKKVPAYLFKLN